MALVAASPSPRPWAPRPASALAGCGRRTTFQPEAQPADVGRTRRVPALPAEEPGRRAAASMTPRGGSVPASGKHPLVRLPTGALRSDAVETRPESRRSNAASGARRLLAVSRTNGFTKHVDHTVESLSSVAADKSHEDVRRILADIRRQYDEVHCEANRKEAELLGLRGELKLFEADTIEQPRVAGFTRQELLERVREVTGALRQELETRRVYQHVTARLKRELRILGQKVEIMQSHLQKKTNDIFKLQECSRRLQQDKVSGMTQLETLEQELVYEREARLAAVGELEFTVERSRTEVRNREEFERWRYDVALEAATEAFHVTAGRYRKLYAIEKLTGNCLQKITYEQAEQSQTTEDGFQQIREVTGLTDVMDIVHKFLNRELEHEQLRNTVREAEARLHSLRETEASRNGEGSHFLIEDGRLQLRSVGAELAAQEAELEKAQRDHEEYQRRLRQGTLLFESVSRWAHKVSKTLAPVQPLDQVSCQADLPRFFEGLEQAVQSLLERAYADIPLARLSKMTCQAALKDVQEQQKALADKDFVRANCRVPAYVDQRFAEDPKRLRGNAHDDEPQEHDLATDRERVKLESRARLGAHSARVPPRGDRSDRPGSDAREGRRLEAPRQGPPVLPPAIHRGSVARRPPSSAGQTSQVGRLTAR